jgi:hypothetical protein
MLVELNYKKGGKGGKRGGGEKEKRRARERGGGKGQGGKRKEDMEDTRHHRSPPQATTCLSAIIFAPLAVVELRTVDDFPPPPFPRRGQQRNLPSCDCHSWTPSYLVDCCDSLCWVPSPCPSLLTGHSETRAAPPPVELRDVTPPKGCEGLSPPVNPSAFRLFPPCSAVTPLLKSQAKRAPPLPPGGA